MYSEYLPCKGHGICIGRYTIKYEEAESSIDKFLVLFALAFFSFPVFLSLASLNFLPA